MSIRKYLYPYRWEHATLNIRERALGALIPKFPELSERIESLAMGEWDRIPQKCRAAIQIQLKEIEIGDILARVDFGKEAK